MRCEVCKIGKMYLNHVKVVLSVGSSKSLVFKNVPVQVCENCGEEFMSHSTMSKILETKDLASATEMPRRFRRTLVYRDKKPCTT